MGISFWQLAVVVVLFILLFGRGRIGGLMTDLADGIKSFRREIREDAEPRSASLESDRSNPSA